MRRTDWDFVGPGMRARVCKHFIYICAGCCGGETLRQDVEVRERVVGAREDVVQAIGRAR